MFDVMPHNSIYGAARAVTAQFTSIRLSRRSRRTAALDAAPSQFAGPGPFEMFRVIPY